MEAQIILQFLISIGLGALIGFERGIGKEKVKNPIGQFFDKGTLKNTGEEVRTFGLVSFLGALTTFLSLNLNSGAFIVLGGVILGVLVAIYYYHGVFKENKSGLTTELAIITTFFLGVFVMLDFYKIALILSIVVTFLLSSKGIFIKITQKISLEELQNTIKFAVISLVILPMLPNQKYSIMEILRFLGFDGEVTNSILNLQFFNPYGIWFFVVLMSGISYAGYIMSKIIGEKGSIIASGAIGGLVSSTAVTASMTESSKKDIKNINLYVVSTLLASTIMFVRVVIIVLFFNINMLSSIFIPSLFMFIGMVLYMVYFYIKGRNEKKDVKVENNEKYKSPFSVGPALKFALFVLLIKFVAGVGSLYKDVWGDYFFYVLGIISGLADVDAISQTMAVDALDGKVLAGLATTTIIIAIISNNFVKGGLALSGNNKFGWAVMFGFIVSMIMGIIGIVVSNMF